MDDDHLGALLPLDSPTSSGDLQPCEEGTLAPLCAVPISIPLTNNINDATMLIVSEILTHHWAYILGTKFLNCFPNSISITLFSEIRVRF